MTMRSAPPIIPTFGVESNNQQYSQYFVRGTVNEMKANGAEGERQVAEPIPVQPKSKNATNLNTVKSLMENRYSKRTINTNDEKGFQDGQSKELKADDRMNMESTNASTTLLAHNSRSAPPIIPTFGDESDNQQYTQYFVRGTANEMKANGIEGERQVAESKSKNATNLMVKSSFENQYSKRTINTNDEKAFQNSQSKELKADDLMNMESTNANSDENVNAYEGRLGNSLPSHPPSLFERTIHPTMKRASTHNIRSTPLMIPIFGDQSNNQQYTDYFDPLIVHDKKVSGIEGVAEPILVQPKSKNATNSIVKRPYRNQYSERTINTNYQKGFEEQLKAEDYMNRESTNAKSNENANAYEGRLGNSLPFARTIHPKTNLSASESPANYMVFGEWENNPNVPITEVFQKYRKGEALPSCEEGQSSPPHTTSWCGCFSPKKGQKRSLG